MTSDSHNLADETKKSLAPVSKHLGSILVVEDDPAHAKSLKKRLEKFGYRVNLAADGEEGLRMAQEILPDIIISDWMMPRLDGLAMCKALRESNLLKGTYLILLSAKADTQQRIDGLAYGVDDYLSKTVNKEELMGRVNTGMRIRKLQRELEHQAKVDSLTGIHNRSFFRERLDEELKRAMRHEMPLTLAMIDLDDFKVINDNIGHLAGDAALCFAARLIKSSCRETDIVCRFGGDEFAVIFINAGAELADQVLTRIKSQLTTEPFQYEGQTAQFGISFGIASPCFEDGSMSPEGLIHSADIALYKMKEKKGQPLESEPSNS